jgi:hypothetical protein
VTLTANQADQTVTRTIQDADGGIATVSEVVSIDQNKPAVAVTGIKDGAVYDAPGPPRSRARRPSRCPGWPAGRHPRRACPGHDPCHRPALTGPVSQTGTE